MKRLRHPAPAAVAVAVALLLAATRASAQEPFVDDAAQAEGSQSAPMLAPTGMRQAIRDIPATVVIIPGDLLSDYGVLTVSEALRLVGGMTPTTLGWSGYDLRLGAKTSTGPERLIVLIDGVEVDATFGHFTNLATLPVDVDDVERIELSSGPSTAGYGHALSSGVVNIVTKHPADVERAYAHLRYGTGESETEFGRVGATFGPTAVRLTLTHHRHGPTDEDSGDLFDRSDITMDRATLRSSTRIGDTGTLGIDASSRDGRGVGASASAPTKSGDVRNGYASVVWTSRPASTDELTARFDRWVDDQNLGVQGCGTGSSSSSLVLARALPEDAPESGSDGDVFTAARPPAPAVPCSIDLKEQRTIATVQDVHVVGDSLRFVLGLGSRTERTSNAPTSSGQTWSANYVRAYAGLDWRVTPAITLNAGASSDRASPTNHDTSVRGGVNWHLSGEQTLRAAFTSGQWASDRLLVLGVPGLKIDSEKLSTTDIGYLLDLPAYNASLSTRVFWQHLEGTLSNPANDRPRQGAYGDIRGLEGRATADVASWCSGYLNLSYAEEGRSSGTQEARHNWIAQGALGLSANWGAGWKTSTAWSAATNDDAAGIAASRLDLALVKDVIWLGSRIRMTLSGRHTRGAATVDSAFASLQVSY